MNSTMAQRHAWWWRDENNLWTFNERNHTTRAKANWSNLQPEEGPIRVVPFVDRGHEQFRTILVSDGWKGPVEWCAHAYEMIRRADRTQALPCFLELTLEEQSFLKTHFGHADKPPIRTDEPAGDVASDGFSDAVRWNLMEYPDRMIRAEFNRWLQAQRQAKNTPSPRSRTGHAQSSPSWRWPEALDLASEGRRAECGMDVALLRQAQSRAQALAQRFWDSLCRTEQPGLRWRQRAGQSTTRRT